MTLLSAAQRKKFLHESHIHKIEDFPVKRKLERYLLKTLSFVDEKTKAQRIQVTKNDHLTYVKLWGNACTNTQDAGQQA